MQARQPEMCGGGHRVEEMMDLVADIGALRGSVGGEVLVAGDPGYDEARMVWNAMGTFRRASSSRIR